VAGETLREGQARVSGLRFVSLVMVCSCVAFFAVPGFAMPRQPGCIRRTPSYIVHTWTGADSCSVIAIRTICRRLIDEVRPNGLVMSHFCWNEKGRGVIMTETSSVNDLLPFCDQKSHLRGRRLCTKERTTRLAKNFVLARLFDQSITLPQNRRRGRYRPLDNAVNDVFLNGCELYALWSRRSLQCGTLTWAGTSRPSRSRWASVRNQPGMTKGLRFPLGLLRFRDQVCGVGSACFCWLGGKLFDVQSLSSSLTVRFRFAVFHSSATDSLNRFSLASSVRWR